MTDQPDWFAPATSSQIDTLIQNTQPVINVQTQGVLNVSTPRTQLWAAAEAGVLILYNESTTDAVFVGDSAVTAANGIPILPGGYHTWVIGINVILDGITLGPTVPVRRAWGPLA
jgi:hypothetical protein